MTGPVRRPVPARAWMPWALVLTVPALVLVVQGNLDVAGAARRLLLALLASAVASACLSAVMRPPGDPGAQLGSLAGPERREAGPSDHGGTTAPAPDTEHALDTELG